jgi:hypothetical protein
MVRPAPIPKAMAEMCHHGLWRSAAKPRNPAISTRQMPQTRWWMCRSPLSTFPGHHVTFGLRISRALVRMNRNVMRNAVSTRNAVLRPGAVVSGNGSTLRISARITRPPSHAARLARNRRAAPPRHRTDPALRRGRGRRFCVAVVARDGHQVTRLFDERQAPGGAERRSKRSGS